MRRLWYSSWLSYHCTYPLLLCLIIAFWTSCRTRIEAASQEQTLSGHLAETTAKRIDRIREDFSAYQNNQLELRVAEGRLDSMSGFQSRYRILIGETDSCFRPTETPGRVGLGIEDDTQQAQLLGNLKALLGFVLAFDEAMGGSVTPIFRVIELCGVGKLAKHFPNQERTHQPLELQGNKLVVWNDKFLDGYDVIRTDALLRQWNKGEIESELHQGDAKNFSEKIWPLMNPIGILRRSIRDRLRAEMDDAKKDLAAQSDNPLRGLNIAVQRHLSSVPADFSQSARELINSQLLTETQKYELVDSWIGCLSDKVSLSQLEEAGTCNSLARASQVSADQFNFALLVNVSNFHNINVNATVCATETMQRLLVEVLPNEFDIKQRCSSLFVSVCTVDNVNVFAQASLQRHAGPTWCLHRSLQDIRGKHFLSGIPSL